MVIFLLQIRVNSCIIHLAFAGVAELADAPHSKCGGAIRAGSSPATGTRIFSPELTEFRAFLLPDSLYSGVLRVKCENRICRRNLAAIIKVGVNIRCRSDVAMSQPLLDVPQTDTVGVKKAGTAMPLRYNYDKPEKPRRIKGTEKGVLFKKRKAHLFQCP